jgi:flagellar basal-body rod modification protein FlgD
LSKIDPSLFLSNVSTKSATSSDQLGRDAFLKILMAQLKNQDPLDPMKDTEFISQLATFSSLEQLMGMSSSMEKLVQLQSFTPIAEYSHLIDKQVSYNIYNDKGEFTGTGSGVVKSVSSINGEAFVILESGEKVWIYDVYEISNQANEE